jgi:hypothetical protein
MLEEVCGTQEESMKTYRGERTIDGVSVLVDGKPLSPHYETLKLTSRGFEWSYEGSEPSQLAFALLLDHIGDEATTKRLYVRFMKQVVANFDNSWEITGADIDAAIAALGFSGLKIAAGSER